MAQTDAAEFLKAVSGDPEFRDALIALFDESKEHREGLLTLTANGVSEGLIQTPGLKQAQQAKELIQSRGYVFTREELYQAAGIEPPSISADDEVRLRLIDQSLRAKGLEGINPLSYTAYSLGVANSHIGKVT